MKILYLRNLYWPADFGGNRYPLEVTRRLARRGHDVRVLTGRTAASAGGAGPDGVRVSYFPVFRGNPLATHLSNAAAAAPALYATLRAGFDVAMVASYDVALPYFTTRSRPPAAFIYHSGLYSEAIERLRHRGAPGRLAHRAVRAYMDAVERRVLGRAQAVVAVSDFSRYEIAAKLPAALARTHLIHTGVDTSFYVPPVDRASAKRRLGIAEGDAVAAVVGRLVAVKRYDRAIAAVTALRDERLPTTLLIVGDGPDRPALEAQAKAAGLGERVRFLGFRTGEEHRDVLWAADIQICSSEFENLSLALLEGLATGLPVVSVPTGGTVGLLRAIDERLLATGVSVGELAGAAARVLRNPGLRSELSARCRAHVIAHHDWERVVDRVESLLCGLATPPR
jgi:glycosyltransferase involved in cell wall biosynthesis